MKTNTLSLLFVPLLTFFGLLPQVQAVSPPPDGGYPNQNTAEGQNALLSVTTRPPQLGGWLLLALCRYNRLPQYGQWCWCTP